MVFMKHNTNLRLFSKEFFFTNENFESLYVMLLTYQMTCVFFKITFNYILHVFVQFPSDFSAKSRVV